MPVLPRSTMARALLNSKYPVTLLWSLLQNYSATAKCCDSIYNVHCEMEGNHSFISHGNFSHNSFLLTSRSRESVQK